MQDEPSQAVYVAAEALDAVDVLEVVRAVWHADDELEGPLQVAAVLLQRRGQLHQVLNRQGGEVSFRTSKIRVLKILLMKWP